MSKDQKSVDELLVQNSNLLYAVLILINGCRASKEGRAALAEWDRYRKSEQQGESNEQE